MLNLSKKPKKIPKTPFLTIFGHLGSFGHFAYFGHFSHFCHFYPFLSLFSHFHPFPTIFDHFWSFLTSNHQNFSFLARSGFFFQAKAPKLMQSPIFWAYWAKKLGAGLIPFDYLFSFPLSFGIVAACSCSIFNPMNVPILKTGISQIFIFWCLGFITSKHRSGQTDGPIWLSKASEGVSRS